MSNLIDNHVPDFLLSPRFKFVRHFLLLLTLGWVFYFLLTSVIIYFRFSTV